MTSWRERRGYIVPYWLRELSLFVSVGIGFVLGATVVIFALTAVLFTAIDRPSCLDRGSRMNIETEWAFWSGCMVRLNGQLLPWGSVVPVERDGKIVFVPKPELYLGKEQ